MAQENSKADEGTFDAAYAKVVAKAWSDPAFKARLLADPRATLVASGVPLEAGVTVKIVEDTDELVHFVLPPQPTSELSDETLDRVAGAHSGNSMNCRGRIF